MPYLTDEEFDALCTLARAACAVLPRADDAATGFRLTVQYKPSDAPRSAAYRAVVEDLLYPQSEPQAV